jgi:uncharacterized protein
VKRIAFIIAGWISLLTGIAGLFLPVLQGWFFILLGLVLLSTEYVWAHHLLKRLRDRFPKLASAVHRSADRISKWLGIEPVPKT